MKCAICYTTYDLVYTACNHNFCESCIVSWLEIKRNCPVCRRSVWDYRKCKISNKKIKKKTPYIRTVPPRTRSKTKDSRINTITQFIANQNNRMLNAEDIHEKITILENIFKTFFPQLTLIREMDESFMAHINNLIEQLENNPILIHHNYLDKVKMWKYKLSNT